MCINGSNTFAIPESPPTFPPAAPEHEPRVASHHEAASSTLRSATPSQRLYGPSGLRVLKTAHGERCGRGTLPWRCQRSVLSVFSESQVSRGFQAPGVDTRLSTDSSATVATRLRRPRESNRSRQSSRCRGPSTGEVVRTKAMGSDVRSVRRQEAARPSPTSHRDSFGTPGPGTSSQTHQEWESRGP